MRRGHEADHKITFAAASLGHFSPPPVNAGRFQTFPVGFLRSFVDEAIGAAGKTKTQLKYFCQILLADATLPT